MKNIQVIDGAKNAAYDIYSCTEEEFVALFPGEGQNIEFIEDVEQRLGPARMKEVMEPIWRRPVRKHAALGIHGTLFYHLSLKKEYYPNKRESDLDRDQGGGRSWRHG